MRSLINWLQQNKLKKFIRIMYPLYTKEILIALMFLFILGLYQLLTIQDPSRVLSIERPNYNEPDEKRLIYYYVGKGTGKEQEIQISLGEGEVSKSEIKAYLKKVSDHLSQFIAEQNKEYRKIESPINLPENFEKCRITYQLHPENLVGEEGWLDADNWNATEHILINYIITIETESYVSDVEIDIDKAAFTDIYLEAYIKHKIEVEWRENSLDKENNSILLPSNFEFYANRKPLTWSYFVIGLIVLICASAILSRGELKLQEVQFKKLKRIHLTYLINNFILFYQTGMTIQKSLLQAMTNRIEVIDNSELFVKELCELVKLVEQECSLNTIMESFLMVFPFSEGSRFARLLMQNMRQGDHLLVQQLQQLASSMWDERIRRARKESEKASSKLVVPMVLIFIIILVITIVPTLIEVKNYI